MRVTTENGKTFDADAVIVTVPLGVLKANVPQFEPRLPNWKEAAIADLGIGNENKIALFFESVFWPNVEFLGVVAPTSYGCSYFLNLHKQPVTLSWCTCQQVCPANFVYSSLVFVQWSCINYRYPYSD